jgi:hypothetical protein
MNNNARAMALSGGTGSPQNIDPTLIEKFMVTIGRNTRNTDFERLSEIGVIGVCIEAGYLFSSSHMRQRNFMNPKIASQVQGAKDAELDFSLYMDARARTPVEAMEEMEAFQHMLRRHTPTLGVWLKIHMGLNKSMNDLIVDEYYKHLVKFGLVDKVGFYCNRRQLELIDWERHKENWYWWKDEHVSDIQIVNTLLTPQFFMYNEGVSV